MKFQKQFEKKKFKIAKTITTTSRLYCGRGENNPPQLSCFLTQKPDIHFYFIEFYFFFKVVQIEPRALFMLSKCSTAPLSSFYYETDSYKIS